MKHHLVIGLALAGFAPGLSFSVQAEEAITNRLSLSARLGFGIKAQFSGVSHLSLGASNRRTPGGDLYNYDDGYVLTDVSGNAGGQTWYWGYDNSASQLANNHILLSKSALNGSAGAVSTDENPAPGGELLDRLQLLQGDWWRLGFEGGLNFLSVSLRDSRPVAASVTRTVYPFAYTPGTTPPTAAPGSPYQGSFNGPGFLINSTPDTPQTEVLPGGAVIEGQRSLDAALWGCRLGPYLELPLTESLNVSLSAGLAGGLLNASVSWNETAVINGNRGMRLSGSGSDTAWLWGFYVGGEVDYQLGKGWSAILGGQFQRLDDYQHSFSGREVELNLKRTFFVTLGVGYTF